MIGSIDFVVATNGCNSCYKEWCSSGTFRWLNKKELSFLLIVYKIKNSLKNVVRINNVVSYVVEEACPINGFSSYFLEQAIHYTISFKAWTEGLVLRFKGQFKGSDDKV